MPDLFEEAIEEGKFLATEQCELLRAAMAEALPVEDGRIDWSKRQLVKKWYWPRRGLSGLRQLLADLPVEPKIDVYVLRSDRREIGIVSFEKIARHPDNIYKDGETLTFLPLNGRWIGELAADGYLYFDFSIPDEHPLTGLYGACPVSYK